MSLIKRLNQIMISKRQICENDKCLIDETLKDLKTISILPNTIAIIESHKTHAEILPSAIKYFMDLGYNVHLFCIKEHEKMRPLDRCNFDKRKIKVFSFPTMPEIQDFFDMLYNYSLVFVTTIFTYNGYSFLNALEKNYMKKYAKNNVYCIDHDFTSVQNNIETIEQRFLSNNRVFVLRRGITYKDKMLPYLTASYFGEYILKNNLNQRIEFVSVGGSLQSNLRNLKLLFSTIDKLIDNNIDNFKIIFIGSTEANLKELINDKNKNYLDIKGFIPFDIMIDTINNADFILYNIDKLSSQYKKYLTWGITGSYNLTLAFSKPSLIYKDIAKAYNIDKCSITYINDLYLAMKKAIQMPEREYLIMQTQITKINKELQEKSLQNLKDIVDEI